MVTFRVQLLPRTDDEAILSTMSRPLRMLRLKSLQTDPDNFRSKYSDEVAQPHKFWINRLKNKSAIHWLAYDIDNKTNLAPYEAEMGGKLIAFLVVVSQGKQAAHPAHADVPDDESHAYNHYEIGAVYVDPDYRGHGLSAKLISAAIQEVKSHEENHGQKLAFTLGVRKSNAPAVSIYRRLGFVDCGQDIETTVDGEQDSFDLMRLDLVPEGAV